MRVGPSNSHLITFAMVITCVRLGMSRRWKENVSRLWGVLRGVSLCVHKCRLMIVLVPPRVVTYYGLVDAFNATDEDSLIMNANLYFHLTGYTHEQNLIENIEMPVCNDALTAGENNENGACPNDGTYAFDTTYNMPEVDSDYMGWASSGWAGEIVVEMHLARSMDLVGLCTMKFETYVTGSFEKGAFSTVPSAKTTAFAVLGSLALVFVCCMYTCCRKPKSTRDDALLAADDETPTIDYHQASKVGRGGRRTKNKKDGTYLM